jgi:hypothetical protein
MTEAIAPTPERLRKSEFDRPEQSATVQRVAYRAKGPFERLHNRGCLSCEQLRTAQKIDMHHSGAMGVKVGNGDGGMPDLESEYSQTYHAQQLANAAAACLPRQWQAIMMLLEVEQMTMAEIGRMFSRHTQKAAAHGAGLEIIQAGLDSIGRMWGITGR